MKLATFADPAQSEAPRLGVVRPGGLVDVGAAAAVLEKPLPAKSVKAAIGSGPDTLAALADLARSAEARGMIRPVEGVRLLPPIPDPSKFLCVGKNSRQHREELIANQMLKEQPTEPTGFIKLTDTMCGQDAEVERPEGITTLDYEPELVFVIGKRAHRVSKADALAHVGGFTLFNDLSAREIQKREVASGTRFWTAKNMPGFAPIGPYVATLDEVADVDDLWITCDVNGSRRLRENTSQFIYKIADVIAHFSRYMPFEVGDLIAMGAPKGVALGQPNAAELYLKPGDRMEIAIEGVMTLRTFIVAPRARSGQRVS
jgi:2-keto-4-pentenoate hydratase/2-oxohepta-3-ene-1,7-dioic acid hydratase in catechol pathway